MTLLLTTGCMLTCSFGEVPAPMLPLELPGKPLVEGALVGATIEEIVPLLNIPSFGMCSSLANPEVVTATAAAEGVLTPMPCVPVTTTPWAPPSLQSSYTGVPLATTDSRCLCAWAGEISVVAPDQAISTV